MLKSSPLQKQKYTLQHTSKDESKKNENSLNSCVDGNKVSSSDDSFNENSSSSSSASNNENAEKRLIGNGFDEQSDDLDSEKSNV